MISVIVVGVLLGLSISALPVVITVLRCRKERRHLINKTLEAFDREFPEVVG